MQRRLGHREKVCNGRARGSIRKRSRKRRLTLARVVSERRVANFIEVGSAFERAVKDAPTRADARRSGFAQNLAEQTVIVSERISQSQPWSEIVPTGGRQRARNTWVTRKHPPCR